MMACPFFTESWWLATFEKVAEGLAVTKNDGTRRRADLDTSEQGKEEKVAEALKDKASSKSEDRRHAHQSPSLSVDADGITSLES
jgi:hypothetical protein